MTNPDVRTFFDEGTQSATHVVVDPFTHTCAVIDPVLGFEEGTGLILTDTADQCIAHIKTNGLTLEWILETHIHTDRLSALHYFKQELGGKTAISEKVTQLQQHYDEEFHADSSFKTDGSQFDHLFSAAERFMLGHIRCIALPTPGHTPESMTYFIGDTAFVGDTLYMPDIGTARTDLPGSDIRVLYDSIQDIFEFPPETRLYMCHDQLTPQRDKFHWQSTIEEQRTKNIHVHDGISLDEFTRLRQIADSELDAPASGSPIIHVNIRAGNLPEPEENGNRYLKMPVAVT